MPASNPGSNGPCANSYCSYLNFNNNGAGYNSGPNITTGVAQVLVAGVAMDPANYHLFWRYSATKKGCATNLAPSSKTFAAVANKVYVFTVYFNVGQCPAQGTTITFNLNFQ
jgi:hypothetical protein